MHTDRGQNLSVCNLWEYGILKEILEKAVYRELEVLIPDLNGINMANIIYLNRFIFQ